MINQTCNHHRSTDDSTERDQEVCERHGGLGDGDEEGRDVIYKERERETERLNERERERERERESYRIRSSIVFLDRI